MERLFVAFVLATYLVTISEGMQLTFTLPDNEKMCFYESVNQEEVAEFEFQVRSFLIVKLCLFIIPKFTSLFSFPNAR